MNETNRPQPLRCRTLALAAALMLALPAPQALTDAVTAVPTTRLADNGPRWGFELAKRTPDPAVRFGRLPNGLRYAIQHNETPKDGVAMRMRIGSGSLQERDEERGLSHFLEHMAFRGSANVPDGEVVRRLERQGLRFGADTNASTGLDQTLYHFNFPKADAAALDTGLMLFREIGDRLTLAPQLIEQEKGVILSEERLRDGATQRAGIAQLQQQLAGTRVLQRLPIGLTETIQAATAERLRRYYRANYRPDNTTLIVVGNIDVDAVERQIRERFADWRNDTPADAPDLGVARPTQPVVEYIAPDAPSVLTLAWLQPVDLRPHTPSVSREFLVQDLAVSALNQRLGDRAQQPGSPLLGALAGVRASVYGVAGLAQLVVQAQPGRWTDALDAVVAELRQLLVHGVTQDDLQRLLPGMRSKMQRRLTQESTRPHAEIADRLVNAVHPHAPHLNAQQALTEAEPLLAAVQPEELTAVLRRRFGDSRPLLFRSDKSGAFGVEKVTQELVHAMTRPLAERVAVAAADWPYTDFGAPSAIVSRTQDAELGTTHVQFANGTRLVVKPTSMQKDQVNVRVLLGQGRAGIASGDAHAIWALGLAIAQGGTVQRSAAEIAQWRQRSGKRFSVGAGTDLHAFTLSGTTRPADLLDQLQVLAAHARDPGFRPEFGEKLAAQGGSQVAALERQPTAVHAHEVERVMERRDARLRLRPSADDVSATRAADLPALLKPALAGAADVVIVGDVTAEAAIAAVQATFGAGDERPRPPRAVLKVEPVLGGGAPHVVHHRGRADQAVLGWSWAMPDHWEDPALAYTGRVASSLLRARLDETVRAQMGLTYSPLTTALASQDVQGLGRFTISIETPPEKFDAVRALLHAQLRALADQPVSADELQRALQPRLESALKEPENPFYWVSWLSRIQADPRMKAAMRDDVAGLRAVTAAGVQAYFRDHIAARAPVEVVARAKEP
ncbi:insulinase family protein [Pelomonas sp. UHG3]|uniref:Insulinase family protein n=1 Tax=Roseateles hydrophilus TaxID=2975054 RepID=A0ACC6CFW4_9BURK|nr:M16 family metallopeptidase [Pelomonas sp. UHG3]MCY4747274.1 insulinase family protein [Pelomonas sp. UHG3]